MSSQILTLILRLSETRSSLNKYELKKSLYYKCREESADYEKRSQPSVGKEQD